MSHRGRNTLTLSSLQTNTTTYASFTNEEEDELTRRTVVCARNIVDDILLSLKERSETTNSVPGHNMNREGYFSPEDDNEELDCLIAAVELETKLEWMYRGRKDTGKGTD